MWRICFDLWVWRFVFSETKNGSRLWENPENKSKKNKHKNSHKNSKSFLSLYWAIWKILSLLKHFEAKHLSRLLLCIFFTPKFVNDVKMQTLKSVYCSNRKVSSSAIYLLLPRHISAPMATFYPVEIYFFKVNNGNTRTMSENCLKS